jgi:hypothetical protein
LLAVGAVLHRGVPRPDAFCEAPDDVPSSPGRLVRSEPFTIAVPEDAQAWRILLNTTTRDEAGTPALQARS